MLINTKRLNAALDKSRKANKRLIEANVRLAKSINDRKSAVGDMQWTGTRDNHEFKAGNMTHYFFNGFGGHLANKISEVANANPGCDISGQLMLIVTPKEPKYGYWSEGDVVMDAEDRLARCLGPSSSDWKNGHLWSVAGQKTEWHSSVLAFPLRRMKVDDHD